MRVCLIATEMFSHGHYGGIGALTRQIASGLSRKGIEAYVLTPRKDGQKPIELVDNFAVVSYPSRLYTGLRQSRCYSSIFKMIDADVYHSEEPSIGTCLARKGAPNKKHVVTFIDPRTIEERRKEWEEGGMRKSYFRKGEIKFRISSFPIRAAIKKADKLCIHAKYATVKAMRIYGLKRPPEFLPTPVEVPNRDMEKAERPTVCFLGRWDPRKRPEYFFEIAKRFPTVDFIAMGGCQPRFAERERLLRKKYGVIPNLIMTGWRFGEEKLRTLEASWVLVNTSWRECLPVSFLEASAYRCAILSHDNSDNFASEFGYWAKKGGLDDFADGLEFLLANNRWKERGERGYEYVRNTHEFNRVIDQHIDIYRSLQTDPGNDRQPQKETTSRGSSQNAFAHGKDRGGGSQMRVLYILGKFPVISQTFVLNEIVEMQRKGIEVEVFAFHLGDKTREHSQAEEIRSLKYFPKPTALSICYGHCYWLVHATRRYINTALIAMRRHSEIGRLFLFHLQDVTLVHQRRPDHLHAHFGERPSDFSMLVHLLTGVTYTFTTHHRDIYIRPPKNYKLKSRLATKHVTISEYNKQYIRDQFGVDEENIAVVHCGVDFQKKFPETNGQHGDLILSVARLQEVKGLDTLIKACAELKRQRVAVQCLIVGDGPEKEHLEELIMGLGLREEVRLLGSKTQDEVFALLSKAKIKVLPSRSEGIPVTLMEAMAMKVPVIGPDVNGVPELVEDGRCGFLVAPDDIGTLVERIKTLLTDEHLRNRFAVNGFRKVLTQFNLQVETDKLERLWTGRERSVSALSASKSSIQL